MKKPFKINLSDDSKTNINSLPSLNVNYLKNKSQQNESVDILTKGNLIKNLFSTNSGAAITNLKNYLKNNLSNSSSDVYQDKTANFLSQSVRNIKMDKKEKVVENLKQYNIIHTEENSKEVEPFFSKYVTSIDDKVKNLSYIPSFENIKPLQTKMSNLSPKKLGSFQYFSPKKTHGIQGEQTKLINYCPYCEHCNSIENQGSLPYSVNKRMSNEASDYNEKDKAYSNLNTTSKSILNKALDYILNMQDLPDFDFFSKDKIEIFQTQVKNFPKVEYQNRILYNGVGTFLLALSEGKVNLDDFLTFENKEKLLNSFVATGLAYGFVNSKENNPDFQIMLKNADEEEQIKLNIKKHKNEKSMENSKIKFKHKHKESETNNSNSAFITNDLNLKPEKQKYSYNNENIKSLSPKKILAPFIFTFDPDIEPYLDAETKLNISTILNKTRIKQEIIKEKQKETEFSKMIGYRKKSLCYYLIFLQILSEISIECKERAYLLFTFFKVYFAEQEVKFSSILSKLYDKIKFYKDLCKLVIQQKHKSLARIEEISETLVSQRITFENLSTHKKLIQDLLNIINEKREEIYILQADNEILRRELSLYLIKFDTLKFNNNIRNQLKSIDKESIIKNIREELKHRKHTEIEEILLANSDAYLLLSGQRSYFYTQKEFYLTEIDKYKKMHTNLVEERDLLKKDKEFSEQEYQINLQRMDQEIKKLRSLLGSDIKTSQTQTDIDYYHFNLMQKNHDNAMYSKKNKKNIKMREYIDNVLYNTSKIENLSLQSLRNLIVEVYENKIINDYHNDSKKQQRQNILRKISKLTYSSIF
jgi:hypothetical protein